MNRCDFPGAFGQSGGSHQPGSSNATPGFALPEALLAQVIPTIGVILPPSKFWLANYELRVQDMQLHLHAEVSSR
jgi:hypothetical protein